MISLKRLNGTVFILNSEQIETIEATPDTVITTLDGKKFVVSDTSEEIVEKIVSFKTKIYRYSALNHCDSSESL